jgi:hypothetical protein
MAARTRTQENPQAAARRLPTGSVSGQTRSRCPAEGSPRGCLPTVWGVWLSSGLSDVPPKEPDLSVGPRSVQQDEESRGVPGADEQHGDEEKTAKKDDGEQPVLAGADLIAHHADEPNERYPRKGNQL